MIYNAGGKSSEVIIDLENNTVIKKFKEEQKKKFVRGLGYHCYLRELECLKRLKGHKNFPQLIDYDDEELTITMDYCGTHFPTDGQSRPELLQQVYDIVNTLEEKNIKFTTTQFPYQNILIKDNIIKMIDFELALPDGSDNLKYFKNHLIETIREKYDIQKFENEFKILVVKGVVIDDHKYERTLKEANDMVKNEWNNYQKSNVGNSAKWRINKLDLTQYGIKVTNVAPGAVATEFSEVRFKGDQEKTAKVYQGYDPLLAEDIADFISYALNAPERVTIADVTIFSKAQASPKIIYKD